MSPSDEQLKDAAGAAARLGSQAAALRECGLCRLSGARTQVVFGVGSPVADLMFIGEGPGFNEDKQGEPFVGAAGKLLTELLASIGLKREDVYIANVVKCRPPENRDPLPDEIAACSPHLMEQVRTIRPRVVCTLGRFATRLIAETDAGMGAVRGRAKSTVVAGVPVLVFPVFHPAAALYTPANREVLQADFMRLRRLLDRGVEALAGARPPDPDPASPPDASPVEAPGVPPARPATPDDASASSDESGPGHPRTGAAEQLPLW